MEVSLPFSWPPARAACCLADARGAGGPLRYTSTQQYGLTTRLQPAFLAPVPLPAGICPYDKVVCLVVDECHRATGVHDGPLPLCAMPEPNAWVDLWWRTCLSHGCAASLAPPSVPACRASGTPASRRPVSTNPLTACALQASTMSCTRYSTCGSTSAGFGCWGCRPRRVLMAPRFRCEEGSQGVQTGLCLERSAPGAGCGLCA